MDAQPAGGGVAATVEPGETLTYELTATNTGRVPTANALASIGISDLIDDAVLQDLPAGITRTGNTLTWSVPPTELAATAQVSFTAEVAADASDATLAVSTSPASLGGFCGAACSVTSLVDPQTITPAPTPTIEGTAKVGEQLTVNAGAWPADVSLAYVWAVDGVPIGGATTATLVLVPEYVGKVVTVSVTGSKPHWLDVTVTSAATAAVAAVGLQPGPVPVIEGTAKVGEQLTVNAGAWPADVSLAYVWAVDGVPIGGATTATLVLVPEYVGKVVTVSVTGSKPHWLDVTVTSAATAAVAAVGLQPGPVPVIEGVAKVDHALTVNVGAWPAGVSLAYVWAVDGVPIGGATTATLVLVPEYVGKVVTVSVTGSKPHWLDATVTSPATAPVTAGWLGTVSKPSIKGNAKVGKMLRTARGPWMPGVTLSYQWLRNGRVIKGATNAKYEVMKRDRGKKLVVRLTRAKFGYDPAVKVSKSVKVKKRA